MKSQRIGFLALIVMLSGLVFSGYRAAAIPANPHPVQYTQPDGSVITLLLKGDEFIHWAVTTDGFTIMPNKSGAYEYATLDARGHLVFSGVVVHNPANRGASEASFVQQLKPGLFFSKGQIDEMKALKLTEGNRAPSAPLIGGFPTTGTRKLLMILANFSNTSTTYSQSSFNNYMNQANYNGTGSFRDYYLEVSYGQLTVNSTVTIWVTLPHTHDYYGPDTRWGEFAYDAVVAANSQAAVNYAEFDNDLDGYVDGVAIIHQGEGQEYSGDPNDIWSHSWDLQSAGYSTAQTTFDGVIVSEYTTQPEIAGTGMSTIGVMCHEFGHNLGAPDFYDVDYATGGQYTGTGEWDLMGEGAWNGANGTKPAHHNAWTKNYFTWTNPTLLTNQQTVLLRNAQVYTDVVRYNTTTTNEYFLCENRQQTGFDVGIPGHGMLIYHVDGNYINAHLNSNDINAGSHQGLYQKAANSTNGSGVSTSSSSKINTSGCPWPGTSNKTTFTDATTPHSKSWAGANTSKPLTNIAENTATKEVTFCFIACSSPDDPTNFTATAASGSQINLAWGLNSSNNPVVVAFSTTPTFGTPTNGTAYSAGSSIPGGGTVLYNGTNTSYNHTGLLPTTTYYYKAWSVLTGTTYSTGVTSSATTLCGTQSLPFYESFNTTEAPCWEDQSAGTGTGPSWAISSTNNAGGAANEVMSTYQDISSGTTRLVSPPLNTLGYTSLNLSFKHMLDAYSTGATLRVQSSTDGVNWTNEAWSVATSASNIGPATVNTTIGSNVNSATTYIGFAVVGNLYNYDYWYIDDISVSGTGATPSLNVTPSSQSVAAPAGSTSFTVAANGSWSASSNATWCTVTASGTGNGTLQANYTENTSVDARTATITVTLSGATPVAVTVVQAGAAPTLAVTPTNQNVSAAAGSTSFAVTSNANWSASSDATWCTVTTSGSGNGTLQATYTENTTTATRVANITVTVTGLAPVVVTVTQAAANATLSVTPSNQNVAAPAGTTSFSVTSNNSWTAVSNATWCTVTPGGTGTGTLQANYTENTTTTSRVATITVSASGTSPINVTVTQAGAAATLQVTPANQNVAATAGTTTFDVTTNSAWTASSNATWCLVTTSGSGTGQLVANYTENLNTAVRTATITVTVAGLTPVNVTVTQDAAVLSLQVNPANQNVSAYAGSTAFQVTSNSNWRAESDAWWCTVTPTGAGNGTLTATYGQNNAPYPRIANITVEVDGISPVVVTVWQDFFIGLDETPSGSFTLMPNPTKGMVIVTLPAHTGGQLTITDLTGRLVMQQQVEDGVSRLELNLSVFTNGTYLLGFRSGSTSVTRRVVVQH